MNNIITPSPEPVILSDKAVVEYASYEVNKTAELIVKVDSSCTLPNCCNKILFYNCCNASELFEPFPNHRLKHRTYKPLKKRR